MFSQASVILFTRGLLLERGGGSGFLRWSTWGRGGGGGLHGDTRSTCGRYVSYWNALLLIASILCS